MAYVTDLIRQYDDSREHPHGAGSMDYRTLAAIEDSLPSGELVTAETGCGRSTILFSNLSKQHHVFCFDDTANQNSSVTYYKECSVTRQSSLEAHFGATQKVLAEFQHDEPYDCVLIDGPHGYPFPDLEYFHFYPNIKTGGLLIVDDLQIGTIGRMADVIQDDDMWDTVSIVGKTAIFKRTDTEGVPADGDHWWAQNFNRRRCDLPTIQLQGASKHKPFEDRYKRTPETRIKKRLWRLLDGSRFDRRAIAR